METSVVAGVEMRVELASRAGAERIAVPLFDAAVPRPADLSRAARSAAC